MSELARFYQLVDDEWETSMMENPLFATQTGDHRYNDKLGGKSEEDYNRRIKQFEVLTRQLSEIDPSDFHESDKLNYEIFDRHLKNELQHLKYRVYRMPISKVNGFHLYMPKLYLFIPLKTTQDYQNYLSRLQAFPQLIEDNIEIMQKGIEEGQIPPIVTIDGVTEIISQQVAEELEDSPYFEPFKNIPLSISSSNQKALIETGKSVILDFVFPSLNKLVQFMKDEYIPTARDDIAGINLPGGIDFYQHCIRYYTSLDLTAEEIHQIGLNEVQRIRDEMRVTIKKANFEGPIKEFIQFLRSDPQFYVDTPEELMKKTAIVCKKIDGELPGLFKTLPRLPYGIKKIPDYAAPGNYTAYYQPGSGDGTKSGTYYINTYDLKSRPTYEIEALSLHEAVPGHHLQIALQQEIDLPKFRRFGHFTAFTEGWGLYSERLGLECGFYEDPYSNFGRHSYEMWRACRLVVDTGMHVLGWSRQAGIDFMAENTSLSLLNITNEIDRYISWPGQALAYKLGEIKIRELRAFAEKELGDMFDVREFHDAILLNGSLPLDMLENKVKEWIARLKS